MIWLQMFKHEDLLLLSVLNYCKLNTGVDWTKQAIWSHESGLFHILTVIYTKQFISLLKKWLIVDNWFLLHIEFLVWWSSQKINW